MQGLSRLLTTLVRWGLGLCALVLVLSALFVALGRSLAPTVAEYTGSIEARAAAALGMPLSIGSLEGRWHGFSPIFLAHDVLIGQGAEQIRLDQVRVVPDLWASVLAREVRIGHLEVSGLQVGLKEDQNGQWTLIGLPKTDDTPFDPQQTLQRLQAVERISVLDSQITLQPWQQEPSTMTYVGLTLHTGLSHQRLDLRLTLPDGQPLALNVTSTLRAAKWREATADAYLSLPQSDWSKWIPASLDKQWNISALKAGGEVWLSWADGGVKSAVARLNAPQIEGAFNGHKSVKIANFAVNAYFQRKEQGFDVVLDSLAMSLGATRWGDIKVQLQQRNATATDPQNWHVQADRLDLTPLTPVLDALPLPAQLTTVLDALQVKGALRNVLLDYRPEVEGDQRVSFAANLDNVAFNAYHGAPAAGNVSGSISGDLGHGELRMASDGFSLHLDPIFAKPWHYLKANATLTWRIDKQAFTLISPYLQVLGEEGKIAGDFLIRIFFDPNAESYMDLRVGMLDGDGRFTEKYLPAEGLSPAVADWLKTAIKAGAVDEGMFQYQGSLMHNAGPGARDISLFFKVHNTELAFQPGWPELTGVSGDVFIEDTGVRIRADKGTMLGTQVSNVAVDIPHAAPNQNSHLNILGDFQGTLGDGIKILQQAPIGTGDIFAGWQGDGPLQGKLKLDIPLGKGEQPKVVVNFSTDGSRLKLPVPVLDVTDLKGNFEFDQAKGLSGNSIRLKAFGNPVTADIYAEGKPGQPRTRIVADGSASVDTLSAWGNVNHPLPASGTLPYHVQVTLSGDDSQLLVESNLKGVTVDLPAPFGKAADDTRDTQMHMSLGPVKQFWGSYGNLANLAFEAANTGQLADGRGELFLGNGAAVIPAAKGLRINGNLSEFDLAPWQALVKRYGNDNPTDNARQLVHSIDLKVASLHAFDTTVNNVALQLDRGDTDWGLNFSSDLATGKVTFPDAKTAPILIDLQQLHLPVPDPVTVQTEDVVKPDPLVSVDPRQIPALDVHVAQVSQGDQPVGAWSLKLRPTPAGTRFSEMSLGLKGLQLSGDGTWEVDPATTPPGAPFAGATSSWFRGRLEGKNLADVLKAWGFAPTVTSESFRLDADGRWVGSPAWVSTKRYSGSFDAQLDKGQFTEVEGGAQALRVFGLLNFNSIGRRLRLDFSDILGKGLSYDRVKGLLVGDKGVYVTRQPITLAGPSSNLELDGTLDMVSDQVNAKLLVTLPVSNNLPIAALIVGAPAIGGALFLVDKLLGDHIARFASVQYKVEGSWKDPKISFDKPFEKPQ